MCLLILWHSEVAQRTRAESKKSSAGHGRRGGEGGGGRRGGGGWHVANDLLSQYDSLRASSSASERELAVLSSHRNNGNTAPK